MRLHGNVGVEVVQGTVSLLAPIPSTFVHALNFLITTSRTLVLLGAGNRNEGVNLWHMLLGISSSLKVLKGMWIVPQDLLETSHSNGLKCQILLDTRTHIHRGRPEACQQVRHWGSQEYSPARLAALLMCDLQLARQVAILFAIFHRFERYLLTWPGRAPAGAAEVGV